MSRPTKRNWKYSAKVYRRPYTTDAKGAPTQAAALGSPVLEITATPGDTYSGCLLLQDAQPQDDAAGGDIGGLPFSMTYDWADIRLDDTITSVNYPGVILRVDSVLKVPAAVGSNDYMVVKMTGFQQPAA